MYLLEVLNLGRFCIRKLYSSFQVVFASFMIHVIADGVTYTFGIFYVELLKYFGSSKAATAWVASIMTGTTYCVGKA